MTRRQRSLHVWIWAGLGPLILAGVVFALVNRRPLPIQRENPSVSTMGDAQGWCEADLRAAGSPGRVVQGGGRQ